MTFDEIMTELHSLESERNREGQARFGINTGHALGISVVNIRRIGRQAGNRKHELAAPLWSTSVHEARILASIVEDPAAVTEEQMESWVREFDSWDLCDQCCGNLFNKTAFGFSKAVEWSEREREFEKRAGFALMAYLTHVKRNSDEAFLMFLPIIRREAGDNRNFVKKAVNWALREIGKRSAGLNAAAIETAQAIRTDAEAQGKGKGKWVASDALRELTSEKVQ
ncbi:MAG: DNA alkylation repair protein, partial [Chloroflexia bacterium]